MTFRSFSRFVRWYRWELLAIACGATLATFCHWTSGWGFLWLNLLAQPLLVAAIRTFAGGHPGRAIDRARRIAWKRARAMPLRGWTK